MHIPKTSGVALTHGLRAAIRPNREIRGFDRVLFGGFDAFHTLAPGLRAQVYSDQTDLSSDGDLVAGHISFSTLWRSYGAANYLTVLREPVSRILSLWLFWRAIPENQLAPWGEWAGYLLQAQRPLAEFLSCKAIACQTDNVTVRMLLWPHTLIPIDDFIDPKNDDVIAAAAVRRLTQFSFLDVMENPELPASLGAWLGSPVEYLPTNQATPIPRSLKRPLHTEIMSEALKLVEGRSRLDLKLWTLLASSRISGLSADSVRQRAILRNVAWHSWIMMA